MRIYNEDKTQELNANELDLGEGYLKADKLFIAHHEAVEAKEAVYVDRIEKLSNGSTQVWKDLVSPAVEAKEAYDDYEDIQVFVLYTPEELRTYATKIEITELKRKLSETDYQAIKYAEGELTEQEFAPIKTERKNWRARINALEAEL